MADINCVTLTGRLTRDAELKYTQNGGAVVRFSLAVNRAKRNADGSWGEDTSFFDCVYFGKGAEATNSYLTKGRMIAVSGELRQSRWEGQDGQARTRVEITVNMLTLTSSQARGGDTPVADQALQQARASSGYQTSKSSQSSYARRDEAQARPQLASGPEDFQDDDIPF